MKEITESQFKTGFDLIMAEVESGKMYLITADTGNQVALLPYKVWQKIEQTYYGMLEVENHIKEKGGFLSDYGFEAKIEGTHTYPVPQPEETNGTDE